MIRMWTAHVTYSSSGSYRSVSVPKARFLVAGGVGVRPDNFARPSPACVGLVLVLQCAGVRALTSLWSAENYKGKNYNIPQDNQLTSPVHS